MLNQVLEFTLVFMIALLALSISAIVRVRPTPSSTNMNSEQSFAGDPTLSGNGLSPAPFSPAGSGPTLWAASGSGNLLEDDIGPRRTGLIGRRYEARHVRGRMPLPRQPGPSGPPWGPAAPPPAGRPQASSERWT